MAALPLIQASSLSKEFRVGKRPHLAVDDVSLEIYPGETLGLVGESGCGKTTIGRLLLRLLEPASGRVYYRGQDIFALSNTEMKAMRRNLQVIFQDPYASLNPRMTVQDIIGEPLDIHGLAHGDERRDRINELLKLVGLRQDHAGRYPHEFSGGQRQRIGIARALAVEPTFIVCDEPISALDVSIQAQIVNLLKELQERMGIAYLFIAHDLSMVQFISDRVAVMYGGRLMELAPSHELYANPLHPYTQALLSAIPIPDPKIERQRKALRVPEELPLTTAGCPFSTRCPYATDTCRQEKPEWREVSPGHFVACPLIPK